MTNWMRPKLLIAGGLAVMSLAGCSPSATLNCAGVIYVSVFNDGSIQINGNSVRLDDFTEKLNDLKPSAKYIFYYREAARGEPTDQQWGLIKEVLDGMMQLRLPISLSSKPDFSDVVDGAGNSHPRHACPN